MKKTKLSSRRRVALRRVLIAAILYTIVTHIISLGFLLPIQAVRETEERWGIGHTAVIARKWSPNEHKTNLVYLTGNENATFLTYTYLTIYGWFPTYGIALDCTRGQPLYANWAQSLAHEDGIDIRYYFGRVDDPDICRLEIISEYETFDNETVQRHERARFTVPEDAWITKNGRRYFLVKSPVQEWPYEGAAYPVVIGYDAEGNELARLDIMAYQYYERYGENP